MDSFLPRKFLLFSSLPGDRQARLFLRARACSVAFFSLLGKMLLQMSVKITLSWYHCALRRKLAIWAAYR